MKYKKYNVTRPADGFPYSSVDTLADANWELRTANKFNGSGHVIYAELEDGRKVEIDENGKQLHDPV